MSNDAMQWPGRSWYQDEAGPWQPAQAVSLSERQVDVAIIGAGLAGVSTAVSLVERGISSIALLDREAPGAGASGRNGGFVFAGYSLANDKLVRQLGREDAARLHGWTREAVRLVRTRIDRFGLSCQTNDAGVLLADWFGDDAALKRQAERLRASLGFELEFIDRAEMPASVVSARYGAGLMEPGSFHFHPLRHIRALCDQLLARGVQIRVDCPVLALQRSVGGWLVETAAGPIRAREVVLSTGGYDRRLWPSLNRAIQPIATYIAVTEVLGERLQRLMPTPVAVYDTRFAFDYYRPLPDGRLLWGGRISIADRSPASIRRMLRRDLARVFPDLAEVNLDWAWGGWMSYARHEMPILGRSPEGLWHGLAFGGHGMATTTLAGELLAEAISGDATRLARFQRWGPRWAGGWLGRVGAQCRYWSLQSRDALKELGNFLGD